MNIFSKLIITLLLTSLLLLTAVFFIMQWSFDRGMLDYVNKRDSQTLQVLSNNLIKYYQSSGGFAGLIQINSTRPTANLKRYSRRSARQNDRTPLNNEPSKLWHEIIKLSENGYAIPDNVSAFITESSNSVTDRKNRKSTYPPRGRSGLKNNRQPPLRKANRLPQQQRRQPPLPKNLHPTLLDNKMNIIIGRYQDDFSVKAMTLNNNIIGYLALPPKLQLTDNFDLEFMAQSQAKFAYTFIALFCFIILITIPLSRHFVRPIKRLEKAMRLLNQGDFKVKLNITGNDELSSLSRYFNDLVLTLEQNKQSRSKWLADISHELRTPLAIMKGEIEAMQDGIRPISLESLSSLSEEVQHLQKLINDLAELSNAEIGGIRYQKQQLNLSQLVIHNIARHEHQSPGNNLTIHSTITKQLQTWADDTRLNQLLDNLLNNSVKYTDCPGNIFISLSRKNTTVVLTVEDSSPSVPDESLSKLFDHLYRVENSRNRKTGGSGIGLALCKNIVDAHQGVITAYQSKHGGLGIRCTFELIT